MTGKMDDFVSLEVLLGYVKQVDQIPPDYLEHMEKHFAGDKGNEFYMGMLKSAFNIYESTKMHEPNSPALHQQLCQIAFLCKKVLEHQDNTTVNEVYDA